jgi:ABC-type transport system substrate-binding protein
VTGWQGFSLDLHLQCKQASAVRKVDPSYTYTRLTITRAVAPFDNVRIRRAMVLAIDRDAVVKVKGAGPDRIGGELRKPARSCAVCCMPLTVQA